MKSIENIVKQIINENQMDEAFHFSKITQLWNDNYPDAFKNNISLINFQNKTLFVKTTSPVWRKEINLITDKIINNINSLMGSNIVEKINVK
jgi:hypothetical protein